MGVKDRIGKYSMAVIQTVVGGILSMNVKWFDCVEVSAFVIVK